MSDDLKTDEQHSSKKTKSNKADWFLESLVTIANDASSKGLVGITLLTHGFLVSGIIISGREYFNQFAEDISKAFDDGNTEKVERIKNIYTNLGNKTYDDVLKLENPPPPTFIHLTNAKYFQTNGNAVPSNMGLLWRGRISEISGFSLGILSIPQNIV